LFSKPMYFANPNNDAGKKQQSFILGLNRWVLTLAALVFIGLLVVRADTTLTIIAYAVMALILALVGGFTQWRIRRAETTYGYQLMNQLELLLNDERKAKGNLDEDYDDSGREAGIYPDRARQQSDS
jgi:hypothetical protein